jgi:hypothetical protein
VPGDQDPNDAQDPTGSAAFLIAAPPAVLGGIAEVVGAAPGGQVLSAARNGAGDLERLAVVMPRPLASALRDALSGVALIEDDQPVQPLQLP